MQMQSKLRDGDGLSLPEDIILEVLLRLSAKDLCRFRCVSKGWRGFISDPAFIQQRSRAGPLIVAMFGSGQQQELRLLDMDGNVLRVFDVRGRGRLAQTRLDLIFVDREHLGAMIIGPASGRDFSVVGTEDPPWTSFSFIANDYSFGRAAPSGDYKVLRLHEISSSPGYHRSRSSRWCEVATILDGGGVQPSWRPRPWGPLDQTHFFCEHKATVNGVLYFRPGVDFISPDKIRIAAFDLESEEWKPKTIQAPLLGLKEKEDNWFSSITELKGTLCFVHNIQNLGGHFTNLWLLMDPNMSIWVKKYSIQMPERLLSTMPLDVFCDGTVLLLLNRLEKAMSRDKYPRYILQLYNSNTKAFTQITEMAEGFNGRTAFYTGSLLS